MSKSELTVSRWLEAHLDRSAGLTTLPRSLVLADVTGDGDHKLVLTDLKFASNERSRLKVYKGTLLTTDQTLPETPSSLITFYTNSYDSKIPAIAVACGTELLIYKNNKPYFKFTVVPLPFSALEQAVWKKLSDESNRDVSSALSDLKSVPFHTLSSRSQNLLSLEVNEISEYINKYSTSEPKKFSPITCMTTLNRSTQDKDAPACPILATEAGQVFILDPQTFAPLHQAVASSNKTTPYIIQTIGVYDVEFRITIASREGYVTLLRRGWLEGKTLFQTTPNIVDMALIPGDGFIMIATTEKLLQCYTKRGSKVWNLKTKYEITCLCVIPLSYINTSLLAVGFRGGSIHLYQGRTLMDVIIGPDTPSAIIFGQLGQEEHVMVIVTMSGALNLKILKRTADFNLNKEDSMSAPIQQAKPLPLPKRSKLFLEQSMRERQNPIDMHQNFQKDLIRLRLLAARAMVQAQSNQTGVGNEKELLKLSAQVLGLGPKFTLNLTLENINIERALIGLNIILHCNPTIYKLSCYLIKVPLIPPNLSYKIEVKVQERDLENVVEENDGATENVKIIRVFASKNGENRPVLAAIITMPPSEVSTLL
ncbi:BBSome complex member BBS1 [Onthophagus taurus]|uniref:BBSome complex member BBS1 n=1 Tax=Onthophagus taurus TaxID=166361 RepID=UPI000C20F396|nr:Bardet-Biedl syndrome 1 protein homolog [Onthophagus taurus]